MKKMCARWPIFCAKALFKAAKCIIETKGLPFPTDICYARRKGRVKKMEMILENLPLALCLLLGMGLIVVEVFLPGFGLPGVAGIALVGVGTILAGIHFGALTAVALLLVIIAVLAVLISWLLRSAAKGDVSQSKLFLHQKDELGDQQQDMQVLVGHEGKTLSVLRPSGIGDFDGVRLNVVTEGEFIENGTPIRIVRVEGGKIVVKAI